MIAKNFKVGKYGHIPRLFKLVSDLSEDQQLNLLKQMLAEKVKPYLLKSIIDMTEKQQFQLLEKLETIPQKETPIKTVSLDDEQATMRGYLRKSCFINARITADNRQHVATILDISSIGVFVEISETFPEGQRMEVSFSLPDHTNPLTLSGKVVWVGQGGVGVKLEKLTAKEEKIILDYIQST